MAFTSRRSASAKISLSAASIVPLSFLFCTFKEQMVTGEELKYLQFLCVQIKSMRKGQAPNTGSSFLKCTFDVSQTPAEKNSGQSGDPYFHKAVEEVDPILQGFLQVLAERQVLGVIADLLHPPPLCLLCSLLCPVFIIVISILNRKPQRIQAKRDGAETLGLAWILHLSGSYYGEMQKRAVQPIIVIIIEKEFNSTRTPPKKLH